MEITSRGNAAFKELSKLTDKKWRRRFGMCIVEGEKVVKENAVLAKNIFVRKRYQDTAIDCFKNAIVLSDKLFDSITDLETDQGIMAIIPKPQARAWTFPFLVLDGIADPGNAGALLRSALAFGFDTIVCIDSVDIWSPKVIRASSGVQFNLNIIECSFDGFTKPPNALLLAADLRGEHLDSFNVQSSRFGIVLGSEGQGLSQKMKGMIDRTITIPMKAGVESLNVAVSGGVFMYELQKRAFN